MCCSAFAQGHLLLHMSGSLFSILLNCLSMKIQDMPPPAQAGLTLQAETAHFVENTRLGASENEAYLGNSQSPPQL